MIVFITTHIITNYYRDPFMIIFITTHIITTYYRDDIMHFIAALLSLLNEHLHRLHTIKIGTYKQNIVMMALHNKNQELLKLLNIFREWDSNLKEKLRTKLQVINETYNKPINESTPIFNITQSELLNNTFNDDARLIDMPLNEYKQTIKEELYEIVKRQNVYNKLITLPNSNDNKEEYTRLDCCNLFNDLDDDSYYKPILNINPNKENYKHYVSKVDKDKKLSMKQYLLMIIPHLFDSMNDHRDEISGWSIHLNMCIHFTNHASTALLYAHHIKSDTEEIRSDSETNKILNMLFKSFMSNYHVKKEILRKESNLIFNHIVSLSYCIYRNKHY